MPDKPPNTDPPIRPEIVVPELPDVEVYRRYVNQTALHHTVTDVEIREEALLDEVTADFVYIRLHGPRDDPYTGSYDTKSLSEWAGALSSWSRQGRDVYCYFDNDQAGYAAANAQTLQEMLE